MKPDDRLSMYRLVERLGRGGFAEVWRARLEPARAYALNPDPRVLARWLRATTEALLVRGGAHVAARPVVHHLAEVTEAATTSHAPAPLRAGLEGVVEDTLAWVEELAAAGELDVALKVPFHDGYVRQMRREKDILRHVVHPRLVREVQLDLEHEPPFLAMELIKGWSLREALKTEPLPPMAKVLAVMDQLLTVLEHLHRRGMVHGDIKPENIMLEADGSLRLIDLGLGQVSQAVLRDAYLSLSLASRVPLQGTLSYMAPEVRKGETPGPAADLYSAGIMLYEMLVGDVPHGMTLPSEANPERGLSPRFDVLLKWVLHPEPARRIPSARELRERILITLRERPRHKLGTGAKGTAREGTLSFDQWALQNASPFVQGDWLGPFQLDEPLGRGGFGEVWRARRAGDGAKQQNERCQGGTESSRSPLAPRAPDVVALKIALGTHGKDALVREADVTGRLDHPQIPKLLESHLDHDPPYLAIEFVKGRSLRARLVEEGTLSPAEAITAARSLVATLAHCHERSVVHQDLKPENLLLADPALTLHLLDFGLAAASDEVVAQRRAEVSKSLASGDPGGGTFEYMAPERRRGEKGGPPADVYALGVILFESLTGELPRGLTRLRELCLTASLGLEATIERLLEPDPLKRPWLTEVGALLDRERPRDAVSTRGLGRRIARRSRLWDKAAAVLLGAAAIVLVAAAIHVVPWPRRGEGPAIDDAALADALRDAARRAPSGTSGELRALESRLAAAIDDARARAPTSAATAEHRLARVAALRRRREEADALVEQGRWRMTQGRNAARTWSASPDETLERARVGVDHLALGHDLLVRGLEADPGSPDAPDRAQELGAAAVELRAWRSTIARRARDDLADALRKRDVDRLRTTAHVALDMIDHEGAAAELLSTLGDDRVRLAVADALERRVVRHLLAHDATRAAATFRELAALARPSAEVTRGVSDAVAVAADARRRLALALAHGVPPARALAQAADAALLLPPAERPERALTHLRARDDGDRLHASGQVARARRLAWETLGAPDEARVFADLAAQRAADHPEVVRLRLACAALVGDLPPGVVADPVIAGPLAEWTRLDREVAEARAALRRGGENHAAAARRLHETSRARELAAWALLETTDAP